MKFAICNEIFRNWRLEDTMDFAAKTGYDGIEIAPFTLADSVTDISTAERTRIRDSASRSKIEIVGLHWLLAKPEGLHVSHPDAAIRNRTEKYLCGLVDFCSDIGGSVMVFGSPKQRNAPAGISTQQARDCAAATFREPVARAGERGVTICLEPLAATETNFINTAAEAIEFTQQFGSPHFKIILDVKAMCAESKPVPQIIRESWPHFAHFHANDRNLKGPGFGDVDFKPIATALKDVGYDAFVSVEVFNFDEGAEVIATKSLEYLKRMFS